MYVPLRKKKRRSKLHLVRATLAGVAAAGVWAAGEPLAGRALRTDYTDARMLGAMVTRGDHWRKVGWGIHLANGGLFGLAFGYLGLHGWRQGLLAAEVEGLMVWPVMAVADEVHPDRKDGTWPPLVNDPRVFAQEALMHGVFGATLGLLAGQPEPRPLSKRVARLAFLVPVARRAARKRVKRAYATRVERVTERIPEWETWSQRLPELDELTARLPEWEKVATHLPDLEKWAARLPEVEKFAREHAHAHN